MVGSQKVHRHGSVSQPKLQLYDDPHSLFCAKVKVTLYAKNLKWECLPIPCNSLLSELLPLGKIPALIVHDDEAQAEGRPSEGLFLMESEIINEYLEDRWPSPALLPDTPALRAQARLVARVHDLYLEPALRKLYPQVDPKQRDPKVIEAAFDEFCSRMTQLEGLLRPHQTQYAVSDTLSLADVAYPALFLYAELIMPTLGLKLDWKLWPRITQWRSVLDADPHVKAVVEELRPAALDWLKSKLEGPVEPPAAPANVPRKIFPYGSRG